MVVRAASYRFAPVLIVLGSLLAAGNWYLQPERSAAWIAALVMFGVMAVAFLLALPASGGDGPPRQAANSVVGGIVFGGLIMAIPLGMKLINLLGGIDTGEVSQRSTMAIMGLFFVFTGNALPKMLTPLATLRCDVSRVQAAQRIAGWTWVLTGLAYSGIWLWAPLTLAKPLSMSVLVVGMLVAARALVRLRWPRRREA